MPIDFNNIQTTRKREYDVDNIAKINAALWYLPAKQRAGIIGSIIEESGGNPLAKNKNGAYQGLLQWGADRYRIQSNDPKVELANQIEYLKRSLNNLSDHRSWTDGGKGSGYKSYKDTFNAFTNPVSNLGDSFRAFSYGYVRPQGKEESFDNRFKVVQQVYDRIKDADLTNINQLTQPDATRVARPMATIPVHKKEEGGYLNSYADGGTLDSPKNWDELSLREKSDIIMEAVRNDITSLRDIKQAYNEYANGEYTDNPNLFLKGGYKPSQAIKDYISNKEGASMKTNRSFEAEAKDFWSKILYCTE